MTEIHIHIHGNGEVGTTELLASPMVESFAPAVSDVALLWKRVGEIRSIQQTDLSADSQLRDNRQGWVAGILQSIQIMQTGRIDDVSGSTWDECRERFPFPEQSTDIGTLADYRKFEVSKEERQMVPASETGQTFPRTMSPIEVAADPTLQNFVGFEDATGEEPEAVVNDAMFKHATEHLFDN